MAFIHKLEIVELFQRKRLSTPDESQSPITEIKKEKKQKKIKKEFIEGETVQQPSEEIVQQSFEEVVQQPSEEKVRVHFTCLTNLRCDVHVNKFNLRKQFK